MKRFYFTGNIETIIEFFNFKKVPQFDHEDKVYKLYELMLVGFENKKSKIQITVERHSEDEYLVWFEFVSNVYGTGHHTRIDIQSVVDLTMFIKTIS